MIRWPWSRKNPAPIDWNARLEASLKPDPEYLKRRAASKRGWQTRKAA